jgi:hypothetical protein
MNAGIVKVIIGVYLKAFIQKNHIPTISPRRNAIKAQRIVAAIVSEIMYIVYYR